MMDWHRPRLRFPRHAIDLIVHTLREQPMSIGAHTGVPARLFATFNLRKPGTVQIVELERASLLQINDKPGMVIAAR